MDSRRVWPRFSISLLRISRQADKCLSWRTQRLLLLPWIRWLHVPSSPMILQFLFALHPAQFKALKVMTYTTLRNAFYFNEPCTCLCFSTFYFHFLLKAKDKLLLFSFEPIVLLKRQLTSDDPETSRLRPMRHEHCGPYSDKQWRARRAKHILAV